MAGSMDDREVRVVHANEETVLTLMVFPDGTTQVMSGQPKGVVAYMLREVARSFEEYEPAPLTAENIEMVRTQVDGMIGDLERKQDPMTTQQIVAILNQQRNLSDDSHRELLALTAALLLQRVVCA